MEWWLDLLLGERDWCVVDDGLGGPGSIYACPCDLVQEGDTVLMSGLRYGGAAWHADGLSCARPSLGRPTVAELY